MHFDRAARQSYRQIVTVLSLEDLAASTPPGTPWLGLDLGEKTIGVAVSDTTRMIASPLSLVRKTKFTDDANAVLKLMDGRKASGLVIGLPLNMDGSEGPRCQSTRQFVANLVALPPRTGVRFADLPVLLQDERLSTAAVERTMVDDYDMSRARRAERIDAAAAAWILQSALDRLRNASRRPA